MLYKYNGNYELPQAMGLQTTIWGLNSPIFPMYYILRKEQTEQVEHINNELFAVLVLTNFYTPNTMLVDVICCKLIRYVFLRLVPLFVKPNKMEHQKLKAHSN
jgi:hypothetical protein